MKKRKLLSLLVLLMTAVTGAWAEDTYMIVKSSGSTDFVLGEAVSLPYTQKISALVTNAPTWQSMGYSAEIISLSGDNIVKGTDDGWNTEITINNAGIASISARVSKGDDQTDETITITVTKNPISGYCGDPSVNDGENVTWSLNLSSGVLTISGTGAMADYTEAGYQPWAANRSDIKAIVINEGVTSIGKYAFSNCESATSISIPASVTCIGNSGFFYCTGISSFTIAANSSLTTIGSYAFYSCSGLQSVTFPASVTSIGNYAFDCSLLTTVTLNSNPSIGTDAFPSTTAVTMNLTANSAGGAKWMTFYNKNYSFQADAYTQVFKVALSGDELTMNKVNNGIVDKNTAVVLKTTGDGNPVMTLTTTASGDEQANSLKGVSDAEGVETDGIYVLNNGTQGVGFYKLASGKKVGVGKAYLRPNSTAREFFGFGEATGIVSIENGKWKIEDDNWYGLDGRKLDGKPTRKGLYIVNGKMVVIK